MKFLALLLATITLASAQTTEDRCTVAVGVSNANEACDEHIKDELTAFGAYAFKKECPETAEAMYNATDSGAARRQLRGSQDNRKLYCDPALRAMCATSNNGYSFCWYNMDCHVRRLQENGQEEEEPREEEHSAPPEKQRELQRQRELEDIGDPLLGAGWQTCKMRFGEFNTDVEELLLKYEINTDKAKCWKYVWCRVLNSELAAEMEEGGPEL